MSDYKLAPQYDTSKNITGIEVHTNYIAGLDLILLNYFTSLKGNSFHRRDPLKAILSKKIHNFLKCLIPQQSTFII